MKYNDKLIIRENDSHSMILSHIRENSKILEFGSANGMMTQYMKEELGCQVYIVEYEKEAYEDAIRYATDGLCGDIMKLEWYDKFQFQFDYILFADVLEHLSDPLLILQKAKDRLDDKGEVLISVPNIAHNDIILKLLDDNFNYTEIGLLDDTHIHFFAKNNIDEFVHEAGYEIVDLQYVTIPTFQTEQFYGKRIPLDSYVENMLSEREYGEVYQFIIKLKKPGESDKTENLRSFDRNVLPIKGKIYFDRGKGYTEEDAIFVEAEYISSRKYRCVCQLTDLMGVREVRYDPIEWQGCMITKCRIEQGDIELKACYSPSLKAGENIVLFDNDPAIRVMLQDKEQSVRIEVEFIILGQEYIEKLILNCSEYYKNMTILQERVETDIQLKDRQLKEQNDYIIQQQEQIEEKDEYIMQCQKSYQEALENKEEIIQSLSNTINKSMMALQERIEGDMQFKEQQIVDLRAELLQVKDAYEHVLQTKSWKYTQIFRKIGSFFHK